jgi:3alpha(or 20beta)-hydroxysteroid dehydrogenase
MGRVDGKVIVITGAAGGQGAAEASALASEGAVVIATDVQDPVSPPPDGVTFRRLDVGSEEEWATLASHLRERHGVVHGLINNAGVTWRDRLLDVTVADWDRVFRINVTGCLLGIQAVVPLMTEGGSIVNVSSRAGASGYHAVAYGTSKWAVRGLSRTASTELGPRGIRVNTLLPGYIETAMSGSAPDWFRTASIEEIPLGRLGTVQDVAPLIVFLMADESSWISGCEFHVDGGEYGHAGVKRYSDLARSGGLNKPTEG